MKSLSLRLHIATALLASNPCLASEEIACPEKIRLASGGIVVEDVPAGYIPFVPGTIIRLTGVTVFDGAPADGAVLMPVSSRNGRVQRWVFEGTLENERWASCDYAQGVVRLTKLIPGAAASCTATFRKANPYNQLEATFECK